MKCLCFSDSHGSPSLIRSALRTHPDAEAVFYLGDGLTDILPLAETDNTRAWFLVRGNCDYSAAFRGEEIKKLGSVTLCGKRITYTHGDLYGAKYGFDGLTLLAERTESDIILYGHTHTATEKYFNLSHGGVYLFNPGSAALAYGTSPSYGIITLTDSGVLLSHATLV